MLITGVVLTGLAALIHVYIFYMESLAWTSDRVRALFGMSAQDAENTKEMAFNQGLYNLFLAIAVFVGAVFLGLGNQAVGATLIFVGAGSMVAAAAILFISSADKRGAALKQGVIPAVGVVLLAISLVL
ncbi:DUF1304 domain-containing protein [Corynebacterium sp. L4756]|uniref:DUF1304 domain-containing protein n=1 Tax=unclassified Corynebacterium TaxID=2624378 RepID=UPI00374D3F6C